MDDHNLPITDDTKVTLRKLELFLVVRAFAQAYSDSCEKYCVTESTLTDDPVLDESWKVFVRVVHEFEMAIVERETSGKNGRQ